MLFFLDTETTGTGPDDRLCQLAYKSEDGAVVNELFNPGMPISLDAMCVHHITNEMVQNKPSFKGSDTHNKLNALVANDNNVIVAHNAQFDISMLNREDIHPSKVICTLKLARTLDKNGIIPKHSLQYLRYYLKLNIQATAHDALGDILVLEGLFSRMYAKFQNTGTDDIINEMIRISNSPVLIARMPFGKHKSKLFSEIPRDYLEWLKNTDLDEDLKYTVDHYLNL